MITQFTDPVCRMDVPSTADAYRSEYQGTTYYFCCVGCQASFEREPEKFVGQTTAAHSHACC